MAYRLNLGSIRGMDALSLEITVQNALRRPIGGVDPASLADLLALAELGGFSATIDPGLEAFVARMASEIADLPTDVFTTLVTELDELGAARIPNSLRGHVITEVERESRAVALAAVAPVAKAWSDTEPEPFPLGGSTPRVARATEAKRNDARFKGSTAPRGEPATTTTATKRASKKPNTRTLDLTSSEDVDKDRYIEQSCLERLAGVSEKGLLEAVILAGVRHGARSRYPELGGYEVKAALTRLQKRGAARFSAGRWSHAGRRW